MWVAASHNKSFKNKELIFLGKEGTTYDSYVAPYVIGRLYFENSLRIPILPVFLCVTVGLPAEPASIDDLLQKEYIQKTNYKEYYLEDKYKLKGDYAVLEEEMRQIPERFMQFYFVTRKGNEQVMLQRKTGSKKCVFKKAEQHRLAEIPVNS